MLEFFLWFVISILAAYGLSVALVEKGNDFPIRKYNILLKMFLRKYVHWKSQWALYCTVCTSFWATLLTDLFIFAISRGQYFFWPLSGFVALGLTWTLIEFLNALDSDDEVLLTEPQKPIYREDVNDEE